MATKSHSNTSAGGCDIAQAGKTPKSAETTPIPNAWKRPDAFLPWRSNSTSVTLRPSCPSNTEISDEAPFGPCCQLQLIVRRPFPQRSFRNSSTERPAS